MKYQSIAVIFVLILLPIALVLSNYIQNQTDTLALETSYKTKLADSTYDAIEAYQINSLNTQSVAGESIKSYVTASVNTFFTTLATNMGISSASKTSLLPYVPAILFTTYDGYYIYSPVKTSKVHISNNDMGGIASETEDDKELIYEGISNDEVTAIESDDNNGKVVYKTQDRTKLEYNYMVKPFIYYSANYKKRK